MPLTQDDLEFIYGRGGSRLLKQKAVASLPVQLARGAVGGATWGVYSPFRDEPPGGVPEFLAGMAGSAVTYPWVARAVAPAVAALGSKFPGLLAKAGVATVPVKEAVSSLLHRPKVPEEALSSSGRILTHGLAMGGLSLAPDLSPYAPPSTMTERLGRVVFGAGLGMLGEKFLGRRRGLAPPPAEVEASSVSAQQELFGSTDLLSALRQRLVTIASVKQQATASMSQALNAEERTAWKARITSLDREARHLDDEIKKLEVQTPQPMTPAVEAGGEAVPGARVDPTDWLEAGGRARGYAPTEAEVMAGRRQAASAMIPKGESYLSGYNRYLAGEVPLSKAASQAASKESIPAQDAFAQFQGTPLDAVSLRRLEQRLLWKVAPEASDVPRVLSAIDDVRRGRPDLVPSDLERLARESVGSPFPSLRHWMECFP